MPRPQNKPIKIVKNEIPNTVPVRLSKRDMLELAAAKREGRTPNLKKNPERDA